jgi:hypothetical protein
MHLRSPDPEHVLEAGFLLLAAGFLTGLGILVRGRLAGGAQRHRRYLEAAPAAGSLPAELQQLFSPAAR